MRRRRGAASSPPSPSARPWEIFPARVRCTGAAVGYNVCLGLLGGTAPILATWLVAATGDPLSPAWYLTASAAILLVSTVFLRERAGEPI